MTVTEFCLHGYGHMAWVVGCCYTYLMLLMLMNRLCSLKRSGLVVLRVPCPDYLVG